MLAFAATLALVPWSGSSAAVITLDFNTLSGGGFTDPYLEDGFRISVITCHYDGNDGGPFAENPIDGTPWMGFDSAGCLGAGDPRLRLDRFGETFDLLSLDVIDPFRLGIEITSSLGGVENGCSVGPSCVGTLAFAGAPWTGVEWIEFVALDDVGRPESGFDNIRLATVPEPSALVLLTGGLGLLAWRGRRRSRATGVGAA